MTKEKICEIKKSCGHIGFSSDGVFEYYEQSGEVYRASVKNAFDSKNDRRHGRWEGTRLWFERYRSRFGV